jgi:3-carboxy-cis,cis-muconate cycloisomerase
MRAVVGDRARLQRMLDFEAALARAQAALGVIPASAVEPITAACRAERYDLAALAEAATTGDAAGPVIEALAAEVAKADPEAAACVNWGAAGQDVVDTALVLELRTGIDALIADLNRAIEAYVTLAGRQRRTASVARLWARHALPMPFGLRVAGYAAALGRSRERLKRLRREALVLQFGGSVGTLAALGEQGLDVTNRLAGLLDLPAPEAPWHSHRDRLAEVAAAFGILVGTCGKIARDVSLLMQTEVGEAVEASPRSGSSSGPGDHHPATIALAATAMAPQLVATILSSAVQEQERASGLLCEWATFPQLMLITSGALGAVADLVERIELDADRMRRNLDLTRGLIMGEAIVSALAGKIGRQEARKLVEQATRIAVAEKRSLQNVLADNPRVTAHLAGPELGRLFEPMSYQGAAQTFIDRLVAPFRSLPGKRS